MKEIFSQLRTKIRLDKEDLLGEGFQHMNYKKNSITKRGEQMNEKTTDPNEIHEESDFGDLTMF